MTAPQTYGDAASQRERKWWARGTNATAAARMKHSDFAICAFVATPLTLANGGADVFAHLPDSRAQREQGQLTMAVVARGAAAVTVAPELAHVDRGTEALQRR